METLNTAFFFVTDIIVSMQSFFRAQAWNIGRWVLTVSLSLAGINYAISGQGLKENMVKIVKAVLFFVIIMGVYPRIIGLITHTAFQWAHGSVYSHISRYIEDSQVEIADAANTPPQEGRRRSSVRSNMRSDQVASKDPMQYFGTLIQRRESGNNEIGIVTYSVVAPAAALRIVLLVADSALDFARNAPKNGVGIPDLISVGTGLLCAFAVMFTGVFAVIEYLMAFLEFMLVAGVGIILFPLSLWDGTKFMAEKLIGAIIGFFIKLLFCNICIFLLLFGYISLLNGYATQPFTGRPDEIIIVLFISFLFFYLCKSAPGLAQSLLTGTPSLSAAGAMGAAVSAIAAGAKVAGTGKKLGGTLAAGAAKTAFAGGGMIMQAAGAMNAVKTLGGSGGDQAKAFMGSMGASAKEAIVSGGGNLARSLLSGGKGGGGSGGGGAGGINRHDQLQEHLSKRDNEGHRQGFKEYGKGRFNAGTTMGENFMVKKEQQRNASTEQQNKLSSSPMPARINQDKKESAGKVE